MCTHHFGNGNECVISRFLVWITYDSTFTMIETARRKAYLLQGKQIEAEEPVRQQVEVSNDKFALNLQLRREVQDKQTVRCQWRAVFKPGDAWHC